MIPWTISQQYQDTDFPSLSGARIVRIAVHPDLGRAGYAPFSLFLPDSRALPTQFPAKVPEYQHLPRQLHSVCMMKRWLPTLPGVNISGSASCIELLVLKSKCLGMSCSSASALLPRPAPSLNTFVLHPRSVLGAVLPIWRWLKLATCSRDEGCHARTWPSELRVFLGSCKWLSLFSQPGPSWSASCGQHHASPK